MKDAIERTFNDSRNLATLVSLLAGCGLLLNWMRLDGATGGLNGAELAAMALAGPGRGDLMGASFLSGMLTLTVPLAVTIATVITLWKTMTGSLTFAPGIVAMAGIALLCAFGGAVSDSGRTVMGGLMLPGVGMVMAFLGHGALLAAAAGWQFPAIRLPALPKAKTKAGRRERPPPPTGPPPAEEGRRPVRRTRQRKVPEPAPAPPEQAPHRYRELIGHLDQSLARFRSEAEGEGHDEKRRNSAAFMVETIEIVLREAREEAAGWR